MKNLFLTAALAVTALGANAQSFSIIPQVGVNLANQRITFGGEKLSTSSKAGFRAGVDLGFGFGDNLSFQPGIFFSQKGSSMEETYPIIGNVKTDNVINYVEIPLNAVYYFNNDQSGFFMNAGAHFAAAVSGYSKTNDVKYDFKIGGDEAKDDIRRWDIGAQAGVGYQTKMGMMVRAQYILGATNIAHHNNSDDAMRNGAINLSLGYKIGR